MHARQPLISSARSRLDLAQCRLEPLAVQRRHHEAFQDRFAPGKPPLSLPKILSSADSRDEAESAHHPARCLPPTICLGRLSPTYSSRNAGLKSRISFSAISSILL